MYTHWRYPGAIRGLSGVYPGSIRGLHGGKERKECFCNKLLVESMDRGVGDGWARGTLIGYIVQPAERGLLSQKEWVAD